MKKTILKITHIASGDLWAGAEVQLFTLCKSLKTINGIEVNVILLNHGELERKLIEQGITVVVFDETCKNGVQILRLLIKQLKQSHSHVVHTHRIKENILGGIACLFSGNIPSLRTVHGAPEHRPGLKHPIKELQYKIEWFVSRYIQKKIIAVSEELKNKLVHEYPKIKLTTIENGVDIKSLSAFSRTKQDSFKIGIVGRLVPVKRIDIFIEIAKLFLSNHPDIPVNFYIYGDGPLRTELELKIGSSTSHIHLEGHCKNIHQKIADLNILLITSDHEGLPMTLLESMALGTPVISVPVGGIPHVLGNGKYGHLVEQQKAFEFSEAIYSLLNETAKTQKKSEDAKTQIMKYYSANSNALKFEELYREISRL